jgi:hypothetical protein
MRMKWSLNLPLYMISLIALLGCASQTPAQPTTPTPQEPAPPAQITTDSTLASIPQTSVPEAPAVVPSPEPTSIVESSMQTQVIVAVPSIHSIADLNGKRLGVEASAFQYVLAALDAYDVKFIHVEIPSPSEKYEIEVPEKTMPLVDNLGHTYFETFGGFTIKQEAFEAAIKDQEIRQALYDVGLSGKQVSEGMNFVERQKWWLGLQYPKGLGVFDAVVVGSHPSSDLQAMIDSSGARILPWSSEAIQALIDQFPEVAATVLPANTYSNHDSDILGFTIYE